jgi:hypothetical protein
LAETAPVVPAATAVLQRLATEALAAQVVRAAILALLLPVLHLAQVVSMAMAQAALAATRLPPLRPYLAMEAVAATAVPVVTQAPMAVREAQALAVQAATSLSLIKTTSPPRAMALPEFLPVVSAGLGPVVSAATAVLRRLAAEAPAAALALLEAAEGLAAPVETRTPSGVPEGKALAAPAATSPL